MTTEKRMTKREMFTYIIKGGAVTEEVKAWFEAEIEKLDKENEKARERAAKKKAEQKPFIDAVLEYLEGKEELVTASEVFENVEIFESVQKASSTLKFYFQINYDLRILILLLKELCNKSENT